MIDLKDLAFTAAEIRRWPHSIDTDDTYQCIAEHCNRILAAKLEKAPVVWATCDHGNKVCTRAGWFEESPGFQGEHVTHQARLVLVEEVGK